MPQIDALYTHKMCPTNRRRKKRKKLSYPLAKVLSKIPGNLAAGLVVLAPQKRPFHYPPRKKGPTDQTRPQ